MEDVNTQSEMTTDGGSSPTEETPVVQGEATNEESTQSQETAGSKSVPYERFKEVNDGLRATQEEIKALRQQMQQHPQQQQTQQTQQPNPEMEQAKQQLRQLAKEAGFVLQEDIQREKAVNEVNTEKSRLEGKYNGADGLPKYDHQAALDYALQMGFTNAKGLEIAYKQMNEAAITQARIDKALQQTRGVQTETSNGTGSANTGVTNDDLMKAAQAGDKNATHLLLKRRLSGK